MLTFVFYVIMNWSNVSSEIRHLKALPQWLHEYVFVVEAYFSHDSFCFVGFECLFTLATFDISNIFMNGKYMFLLVLLFEKCFITLLTFEMSGNFPNFIVISLSVEFEKVTCRKDLSHFVQVYPMPLWKKSTCTFKGSLYANVLSHKVHSYLLPSCIVFWWFETRLGISKL